MSGRLPTFGPVAELRKLGCKVSTVIGHDPEHGRWQYFVTLPRRANRLLVLRAALVTPDARTQRVQVRKASRLSTAVVVESFAQVNDGSADACARALSAIADELRRQGGHQSSYSVELHEHRNGALTVELTDARDDTVHYLQLPSADAALVVAKALQDRYERLT